MKKILLGLLITSSAMLITSCSSPEEIAKAKVDVAGYNKEALKHPEVVGTLPDGQVVSLVVVQRIESTISTTPKDHFIYFVGQATTDNYSVQSGKTTVPVVDVYLPEKPTNEQILAAAEKIKKDGYLKRKEMYEKLKLEFENDKE